ncbi:flavin reductase family protein [Nocardia sp. NPDC004860]|uniref:flavin reductase family protein n=1 Tax=Nocardia sp. NPDC004860 TaxID=3154557 RepID=UPI0033BD9946
MTQSISTGGSVTPDRFRAAISHFASGVTIVVTHDDGIDYGTTASAVCSLTAEPPGLLVCLNLGSETGSAVARTGRLSVNVLREEDGALASRFAAKGKDRFADVNLDRPRSGVPTLAEALVSFSCHVDKRVVSGTHAVFLCGVDSAEVRPGAPLAYYRGRFGGFTAHPDIELVRRVTDELARCSPKHSFTVEELSYRLDAQAAAVAAAIGRVERDGLVSRTGDGRYHLAGPAARHSPPA